jgi:hypothetical protein
MERRKFINISGVSLLGLNYIIDLDIFKSNDACKNNINLLLDLLKVTTNRKCFNVNILSKINLYINAWVIRGYKNPDTTYWLFGENIILYPLFLNNKDGAILDEVLLVFKLEKKDNLIYQGVITGFHIESLISNKSKLLELGDASKIGESILPILSKGRYIAGGWAYQTNNGYFELVVTLENDKANVYSGLIADHEYLWQTQIESKYLMNNNSFTTI